MSFSALVTLLALASPAAVRAQSECPRGTLPAYAHNDYVNAHPLTDALTLGYRGAEADVFLVDGVLRVGHDKRAARAGGSLDSLYLAPLRALVARCGKLAVDGRPFFLSLELKGESVVAHDSLIALLGRYRELLTASSSASSTSPAVNVVLVGWHPSTPSIDALVGWQHRISKADGSVPPNLDARVRLLSLDYGKTMGRWWVTAAGRRRWLESLRAVKATAPNRLLRVHNVPVDARVYEALLAAGVDLIGTKQLAESARLLTARTNP